MINHRLVPILALLFASFAHSSNAATLPYRLDCDLGKGSTLTMHVREFTVRLIPRDGTCHLQVSGTHGELVFENAAKGVQVSSALNLAGDGRQFMVIQTVSSPYKLTVLSLGLHPGVLATVENGYGFWIQNGCADGRWHVWTSDSAFQNEPELVDVYHYDLLVPEVVLDVHGNKLVAVTPNCKLYFDHRIAVLRAGLTTQKIAAFRSHSIKDAFQSGEVKGKILGIVFTDLYIGQETTAHEALREMWPPEDQERVWQWMLKKRSEGVLMHLDSSAPM